MTHTAPRVIAEITDDRSLLAAFRTRQNELDIGHDALSDLCGFPTRWTSKILAPMPTRRLHPQHIGPLAGGLQVKLLMVQDDDATRRFGNQVTKRKAPGLQAPPVQITFSRRFLRRIGRLGGLRTAASRTPEQQKEYARLGGLARAKKLSQERRRAIARHAARIRWAKRERIGRIERTAATYLPVNGS